MKLEINEKNNERIRIAEMLGQPDKVPVDFGLGSQFNFLSGWLNLDGRKYFCDPEYMLDAQIKFIKRFNVNGVLGPNMGLAVEPSAFGARIFISKDQGPWAEPKINTIDELKNYLDNYKEPDPYTAGNYPLFYSIYFYMRERLGDEMLPKPMGMLGPIDTACNVVSTSNAMLWIRTNPDLMHKLLGKITDFLLKVLEVKVELFKPTDNDLGVFDDNTGFFSEADFKEFVIPYVKRIYDSYCSKDSRKVFHSDAPLKHVAHLLPEMGVNVLISFDPKTDIAFFKEKIGDRVCLKGNVHPLKIMRNGTPVMVKEECKRQIEAAKKNGGYVLTTGGELTNGTPSENIDAMIEAAEEYGAY